MNTEKTALTQNIISLVFQKLFSHPSQVENHFFPYKSCYPDVSANIPLLFFTLLSLSNFLFLVLVFENTEPRCIQKGCIASITYSLQGKQKPEQRYYDMIFNFIKCKQALFKEVSDQDHSKQVKHLLEQPCRLT